MYAVAQGRQKAGRRQAKRQARQGANAIVDRAETAIGQNIKLLGTSYALRGDIPQIRSRQKPTTS